MPADAARLRRLIDAAPVILKLYDHLLALIHSPVVALYRAVAPAEVEGPATDLDAVSTLASNPRMQSYQPYWAARGHLLSEAGQLDQAAQAFTLAIGLSTDVSVRLYLKLKQQMLQTSH